MNFFNTDALSGACAGSLLEKIPYAEEKNQVCGIRSLDPYLVKLKRYHLRYLDRYRHLITSKSKYIEKIKALRVLMETMSCDFSSCRLSRVHFCR